MTTALLSLFAACTNDEFISNGQGVQNGEAGLRPEVDVTLNLTGSGSADTRFDYSNETGYIWQAGDKIGALLMDEVRGNIGWDHDNEAPDRPFDNLEEWEAKPWTERYRLVDYVSTDYPFERQADGSWKTNSKMLEGNYFFTHPFADYMGNREAVHSIGEQVQDGRDWEKAYAENQFFIGYARIHAGTQGEDVMSANLEMIPALGAIGVEIKNMDSDAEAFKVEKLVLECKDFSTLIKINPVAAKYLGEDVNIEVKKPCYNIDVDRVEWWSDPVGADENKLGYFNYANYEEVTSTGTADEFGEIVWKANDKFEEEYLDGTWVNNTGRSANYKRQSALRAILNKVDGSGNRAELTVENSPVLKEGESIQLVVMTPVYTQRFEKGELDNDIKLYIYTDKGLAGPISISGVKKENEDGMSVTSNNPVTDVRPGRKSSVTVALDVNYIQQGAVDLKIYNESDLKQLIEWNEGQQRVYRAQLQNDVTLTKEMSDMLMADGWKNTNLLIVTDKDHKVVLGQGVDKNILDRVIVNGNVKVENELELGEKSFVNGTYTTAYGAGYETTAPMTQNVKNIISIAEGGKVTVVSPIGVTPTTNWRQTSLKMGENEGTLDINARVNKFSIEDNQGEMTVNAVVRLAENSKNTGHITVTTNGNLGADLNSITLTNEGEEHGDPAYEENIEYAVIDNYGRISELVNAKYGKLIAHAEAGDMILNSNAGIVDITEDIEAQVQVKTTPMTGDIAYTVAADTEAKAIAEAGITMLVVDGGKVLASTANGDIAAPSVKTLKVTAKGGTVGSDKEIAFSNTDLRVELNGNVTLKNLQLGDLQNKAKDWAILVKSGTTTIQGTVDATGRYIQIASYDWQKYVKVPAMVQIDTKATLYAYQITKADDADSNGNELVHDTDAKLDNDGKAVLNDPGYSMNNVTWTGNDAERDKPAPATVTVKDNNTITATLDNYNDLSAVTTIKIMTAVNLANEDAKTLAFINGKDINIGTNGSITGLSGASPLTVKNLTIDAATTLTGSQTKTVMMKVTGNLDINNKLELTNGWIQMSSVVGVVGEGCTSISGSADDVPNSGIICYDANGNRLRYNDDATQWVAY